MCVADYLRSAAICHPVTLKSVGKNREETESSCRAIDSMGDNSPATRCNSFQFILLRFQSTCFRFKFRIPRFLSKRRLYRQANSTVIGPAHGIGKPGGDIADMSAHALRSGDSIGSRSRCRRTGCPRLGVLLGFQISRISICSAMGHRSSIRASKAGSLLRRALNSWRPRCRS